MNDHGRRRGGRRTVVARRIDPKAGVAGLLSAVVVSSLIVLGSNNLRHFDWVLFPYAAATVCSAAAIAYRYTIWLQRPPTKRYWQQGWRLFLRNKPFQNGAYLVWLLLDNFAVQRFIARRDHLRWIMHLCLSWGGMLAFAITFPLVFGWMHFETPATDLHVYQLFILGVKVQEFSVDSLIAFLSFNALNFSAVLVLVGIALALHRRLTEPGALALQQFGNDIVPLLLLFAVAATGLGLTVSAHWLHGYGFAFMALTHMVTVVAMLLYLPFGKFFHIFQRPAQLGVAFYKQAAHAGPQARCGRCDTPFASQMQVSDLQQVLDELGLNYHLDGSVGHYQHVCPPCRRKLLALNQGRTLQGVGSWSVKETEKQKNESGNWGNGESGEKVLLFSFSGSSSDRG
jgi:NNP family nitrate/nitrite transporter-like MFS transporter